MSLMERETIKGDVAITEEDMICLSPFSKNIIIELTNTAIESNNHNESNDFILIFIDEITTPFFIKRHYLKNITHDDIDYSCNETITNINVNVEEKYYNLYKLFLNYPEFNNIIVSATDLDKIINDKKIKRIHLFKNEEEKTKLTYPKIKYTLKQIIIDDIDEYGNYGPDSVRNKITDSLIFYVTNGYPFINGYLIRLNNYREKKKIPLDAKDITDIYRHRELEFYCYCWYKPECNNTCNFMSIEVMENTIKYIDLAFYKLAPKTTSEDELKLVRGVSSYYPFLNEIGDEIIIENYISTTKSEEPRYGIYMYEIIVSPGIPYIDVSKEGIYGDADFQSKEKEIVLPRNLKAQLIRIRYAYEKDQKKHDEEGEEEYDEKKGTIHTIKLSLSVPNQFNLDDPICNISNLYNVIPYDTTGGKNKRRKYKYKRKNIKTKKHKTNEKNTKTQNKRKNTKTQYKRKNIKQTKKYKTNEKIQKHKINSIQNYHNSTFHLSGTN
jgi:hypothetical protein